MCSSCGFPSAPGHWTEAGAPTPGDRMRARFRRAQAASVLLTAYGLTARDDGAVPGVQLSSATGATQIVPDFDKVWAEAARMVGTPIDPLGDRFLGDA
ncbi:MAG: hypothetical protein CML68_08245 [Rhodobacteraceae bacterium]|nr:hypothetical protein [Paracoccaceae bacterium]